MRAAPIAQRYSLVQVNGSLKIASAVVPPYPVNEVIGVWTDGCPRAHADIAGPRIHVGIVDLSPSHVPDLKGFLYGLAVDLEIGMPHPDNGWNYAIVIGRRYSTRR